MPDAAPKDLVGNGYSNLRLRWKTFAGSVLFRALWLIPVALASAAVVWFFGNVIAGLTSTPYLASVRHFYLGLLSLLTLLDGLARLTVWIQAFRLRVPYKAMLVGLTVYSLGNHPEFKQWDGPTFLEQLRQAALTQRLVVSISEAVWRAMGAHRPAR